MNKFLVLSSLIALTQASTVAVGPLAAATTLVRAPAHDSASIEHHRLGGNFAYSTAESHAFASVTPQISTLTHPVSETIHTHVPAPIATHQPAPIVRSHHAAQPIFQDIPVHAQVPITGPVRTHQTVHQPIVHETRTHTVQAVSHAVAAPVAVAHTAPLAVAHSAPVAVAHSAPVAVANAAPFAYTNGVQIANHGIQAIH